MDNIDYPDDLNSLDLLGFDKERTETEYLKMVIHQRNILAQEIKDFLVKTGGIVEDCCPNGPELIHNLRLAGEHFKPKTAIVLSHMSGI